MHCIILQWKPCVTRPESTSSKNATLQFRDESSAICLVNQFHLFCRTQNRFETHKHNKLVIIHTRHELLTVVIHRLLPHCHSVFLLCRLINSPSRNLDDGNLSRFKDISLETRDFHRWKSFGILKDRVRFHISLDASRRLVANIIQFKAFECLRLNHRK